MTDLFREVLPDY
ncbi:hypothetical protein CAEBREN_13855 [Caenorhabditis brenneri]|uniref:Uncharacterized protein n=1 Tax=Caenorhabditis brenneri TaxID=135651 RepID=G0N285_CAEBE|nr:hypothetical protein CAEBREN_13855 [Caenorhabditis brenneri]